MPDIDGTEVTKKLKSSPVTSTIPILGVSADAFKSSMMQALDSGMVGYVTKPIDFNLLFRLMAEELSQNSNAIEPRDASENDVSIDTLIVDKLFDHIDKLKNYEIYETEKLMYVLDEIDKLVSDQQMTSFITSLSNLKEAVLSGNKDLLSVSVSKMKKVVSE